MRKRCRSPRLTSSQCTATLPSGTGSAPCLHGVGCQLVQRKTNVARRVRLQADRWPFGRKLRPIQCAKSRQLQAHKFIDTCLVPVICHQAIDGTTERSKTTREPNLE